MTTRAPEQKIEARLTRAFRALRRRLIARHALRAAALCAPLLALAVLAGVLLPPTPATATVRLVAFLAGGAIAIGFALRSLRRESFGFDGWLERIEQRFPAVRSWLRNALDLERRPPAHVSTDLAGALREETGRRLADVPLAALHPPLDARRAGLRAGAALIVLALLAGFAPERTARAWRTLWDPALAAPPVTLRVEPGSVTVSPGATLAVRARVTGTVAAPRLAGAGPTTVAALESEAGGERRWRFDLPPVTRERDYFVRVARVESPRYRISLAGEPQPVSFRLEIRSPAYARLPVQAGASTRGDVAALLGSRASVEVTFDRDLESLAAKLPGAPVARWSAITPRRWRGDVPVARDGEYELHAVAASGEGRFRYRIAPTPDSPPVLTVAVPEGDRDIPAGQQVPYDVQIQDDLGVSELRLQFRKDAEAPWRAVPLGAFRSEPRDARMTALWDASALALLPGEVGTFRFEAFDNNAVGGRGRAVSPEFRLRFPSLADLYETLDQRHEQAQNVLRRVADQAREVQKSLDQMQRQPAQRSPSAAPSFERSQEMKRALERQQELAQQLEQAAQSMQQNLDESAERQAFRDELQQKLREMSELLQQVQSPEFKDALRRMQKALEKMDRQAMEQTLPELREQNRDMLKNLERSLALLKQLRDEERMESLAKRAEELKAAQDELNREHEERAGDESRKDEAKDSKESGSPKPPQDLAERQEGAAEKSEKLADDAKQAAEQSSSDEAKQQLSEAAETLESKAASEQKQASRSSEQGQQAQASRHGEQASEHLSDAAQRMSQSARRQQEQKDAANLAAVRRAAQDLVSLEREASENLDSDRPAEERADKQTDLSEGVSRVADSLAALSKETPMLSPKAQQSLGQAMQGLARSGRELSTGNAQSGRESGRSASQSLAEAVLALRESEASMCNKPGAGQPNQQTPGQQMGQIGERQGQLNRESRQMARRLSQQMRLSTGDQAELRRLSEEQARIRAQLESVQQQEQDKQTLLGRLDQARREMQEVEEALRSGAPGADLEEKQTRILSRLLDAQRSIHRRDFDPEREARRGDDVARVSPAEIPADRLRESDRLRLDLLKAGADRYPAQYRAFIEAYLRSLNGSTR